MVNNPSQETQFHTNKKEKRMEGVAVPIMQEGEMPKMNRNVENPKHVSIRKCISKFKGASVTCLSLVVWTNALIIWTMNASPNNQSMWFPVGFHALLTGALLSILGVQGRAMFRFEESPLSYRYQDSSTRYQDFMWLSAMLLPFLTIIGGMTIFHVSLELRNTTNEVCPHTYLSAWTAMTMTGQWIVGLYLVTYVGIFVSVNLANFFAKGISCSYIELIAEKTLNEQPGR
jgi:hypothetical protein